MASKDVERKHNELLTNLAETASRIRRYSLDPLLRLNKAPSAATPDGNDLGEYLRGKTEQAWKNWVDLHDEVAALPDSPTPAQLTKIERKWLTLDREVDVIQRDLIGKNSFRAGWVTVLWLTGALFLLVFTYLRSHGAHGWSLVAFEPWPEWGPWKYGEVAFWSGFGILCYLLFIATRYIARRDFDEWYALWYVSTFLRAPFLVVILMMVILEFVEWYGEGKWIETYLLEEGNKTYFIFFLSFCLGLTSDVTSSIIRNLSNGVSEFVQKAVARVSQKLSSSVSDINITPT
ncbi:MAG: hypothetical protein WAO00_15455 [Chthoniobacterales bacterium]